MQNRFNNAAEAVGERIADLLHDFIAGRFQLAATGSRHQASRRLRTLQREQIINDPRKDAEIDLTFLRLNRAIYHSYAAKLPAFIKKGISTSELFSAESSYADEFRDTMAHAVTALPANIVSLLAETGVKFSLIRRISDIDQNYADFVSVAAENGRPHQTHEMTTGGFYASEVKTITVPAEVRGGPGQYAYVKNTDADGSYIHEAGHAVDHMAGGLSWTAAVRNAYAADLEDLRLERQNTVAMFVTRKGKAILLDEYCRKQIDHYLPKTEGGRHESMDEARSEVFAQIFAEKNNGCYYGLQQLFPRVSSCWDRIMMAIDAEMAQPALTLDDYKPAAKKIAGPTI